MKLSEIKDALRAELITADDCLNMYLRAGTASDLMSDLLTGPTNGALLLTGLCNVQVVRTSVVAGVAAVVFVREKHPTPEMIAQANVHGLPLLSTSFTMFSACGRLFDKGLRGVETKAPRP